MNWILDADIQNFFGAVSQEWLVRFVEHRIGDKRITRLIKKWLRAGILEDGVVTVDDRGTGQGSVISPLLANIYLHYCFDLWAERWRRRKRCRASTLRDAMKTRPPVVLEEGRQGDSSGVRI